MEKSKQEKALDKWVTYIDWKNTLSTEEMDFIREIPMVTFNECFDSGNMIECFNKIPKFIKVKNKVKAKKLLGLK